MAMPPMLAYTITGGLNSGAVPRITIGQRAPNKWWLSPAAPVDDSYWIVIMDANKPGTKVHEFIVPAQNNTAVPPGLDAYMTNPGYIFAVVTQYLSTLHVPQGAFYDYLVKYGAGRELQRLEQASTSLGCGYITRMGYLLTGQCGPRGPGNAAYEMGTTINPMLLLMSLMPMPNGQPPYAICDGYTFIH